MIAEEEDRWLMDLQGSPKQIAWANTIRDQFFRSEEIVDPNVLHLLVTCTDAKWWIDHRRLSIAGVERLVKRRSRSHPRLYTLSWRSH